MICLSTGILSPGLYSFTIMFFFALGSKQKGSLTDFVYNNKTVFNKKKLDKIFVKLCWTHLTK